MLFNYQKYIILCTLLITILLCKTLSYKILKARHVSVTNLLTKILLKFHLIMATLLLKYVFSFLDLLSLDFVFTINYEYQQFVCNIFTFVNLIILVVIILLTIKFRIQFNLKFFYL